MVRLLISLAFHLIANAVGLIVAALVLDDMALDAGGFIIAVVIFTAVELIAEPLIRQIAVKNVNALLGATALVTTFVGLLITDVLSDGLSISGAWTWVLATLIVWLAALLAGLILPLVLFKNFLEERRGSNAR